MSSIARSAWQEQKQGNSRAFAEANCILRLTVRVAERNCHLREATRLFRLSHQVLVSLLIFVSLIGCVPQNIPLKRDIKTINNIVAIAYPTDEVGKFGGPAVGGYVLFRSLGPALAMVSEGTRMVGTYSLPDFGKLVLDNFLTGARNEVSYWPEVIVEQNKEKANKLAEGQFLLEIRPGILRVQFFGMHKGFNAMTTALLKDSAGEIIWQSSFQYRSEDYGRDAQIDQFEENRGKLLKEEWAFGAEETGKYFSRSMTHGQLK